jgi:hypothetical protein
MDIRTWVAVPEAERARESCFYMDDFTLQVVADPPLSVSTPLDDYCVGAGVPWTVQGTVGKEPVVVTLRRGDRTIAEQVGRVENRQSKAAFETRGLRPGLYERQAVLDLASPSPVAAPWQLPRTADPFAAPLRRL